MCKLSITNMLWLRLMFVIQNKHLPILKVGDMLLDTVNICVVRVRNYTTASFFPPFFTFLVLKTIRFLDKFKANNECFRAIF